MLSSTGTHNENKKGSKGVQSNIEFTIRTAACITDIKRTFFLACGMTVLVMLLMYISSGQLITLAHTRTSSYGSFMLISTRDSTNVTNVSIEFPGMPDPCAKPRRETGVEDILCMHTPHFLPNYKNPCWMDRNRLRCLPYFHLIGTCKTGTSDLFRRIYFHPDIVPNKGYWGKEITFWSHFRFKTRNRASMVKLGMTLEEFTNQFNADKIQKTTNEVGYHQLITGHGDPMDIWNRFQDHRIPQNNPAAEELLWTGPYAVKHINPNVKLLLILRDPIDRLYSHYFHGGSGTSAQSFDAHIRISLPLWKECLQNHTVRSCTYSNKLKHKLKAPIDTSVYVVHVREWLKAFPRKQILIFRNEDYSKDIRGTLQSVFQFLDIAPPRDSILEQMVNMTHFYETKKKRKAGSMFESTRQMLIDFYKPYNDELAILLKDDRFAFKDTSFFKNTTKTRH